MERKMIQYVGTKTVTASPISRLEAEEILGRVIKPADGNDTDEGYLVKYEDGYVSWSPKNVFDKAYQMSETFLDRMLIEKRELAERIEKLSAAYHQEGFEEKVGKLQYSALSMQLEAMQMYYRVLATRIGDAVK